MFETTNHSIVLQHLKNGMKPTQNVSWHDPALRSPVDHLTKYDQILRKHNPIMVQTILHCSATIATVVK